MGGKLTRRHLAWQGASAAVFTAGLYGGKAQRRGQCIAHAACGLVQIRVRAHGGNAVLRQQIRRSAGISAFSGEKMTG